MTIKNINSETFNKKIKHVFFDLDGTVIKKDKTVSPKVRAAFKLLKQKGITYSAATGRPFFSVKDLLTDLEVTAPSVSFSGALICVPGQVPIREAAFETEMVLKLIDRLKYYGIALELYTADRYLVPEINPLIQAHADLLNFQPEVVDIYEFAKANKNIIKVQGVVLLPEQKEIYNRFMAEFPQLSISNAVGANRSDILYANITREENLRDNSFDYVTKILGISDQEVLAIGDAESDLSYILKAGIGVAMANSTPDLLEHADYITESVEDDGVASVFEQLKPLSEN